MRRVPEACRRTGAEDKQELVRKERLELSRHKTLEPKSSASTNSATSARKTVENPFGPTVEARDVGTKGWVFQRSPMLTEPTNRSESHCVALRNGHAKNENSLEIK